MDINKILQSKILKSVIIGLGILLVLLVVFKAGTMVGVRKAIFSCRWSDNYHKNFGGPKGGVFQGFNDKDFMDANGVSGQIVKIDSSDVMINDEDGIEKVVFIDQSTSIRRGRDNIKITDLNTNDFIVVIGDPNQSGQIVAKLIRVMPSMMPPQGF
jgi:hypothetical protein